MTALAHRDFTGEGQHVDVSMQEAGASAFSPQILGAMHRGGPEARGSTPLLPCKDGYVSLNVRHDATWEFMWLFFDDPDIAYNPKYATAAARRQHAAEIEGMLQPHLARHTMEELFHGLAPLRLLTRHDAHRRPSADRSRTWKSANSSSAPTSLKLDMQSARCPAPRSR